MFCTPETAMSRADRADIHQLMHEVVHANLEGGAEFNDLIEGLTDCCEELIKDLEEENAELRAAAKGAAKPKAATKKTKSSSSSSPGKKRAGNRYSKAVGTLTAVVNKDEKLKPEQRELREKAKLLRTVVVPVFGEKASTKVHFQAAVDELPLLNGEKFVGQEVTVEEISDYFYRPDVQEVLKVKFNALIHKAMVWAMCTEDVRTKLALCNGWVPSTALGYAQAKVVGWTASKAAEWEVEVCVLKGKYEELLAAAEGELAAAED